MSGYPTDVIAGGDRPPGFTILPKPFTQESLAHAVREALGRGPDDPLGSLPPR